MRTEAQSGFNALDWIGLGRKVNATNFSVSGCLRQVSVGRNPEPNTPVICTNQYVRQLLIKCVNGLFNRECHELVKSNIQLLGRSLQ